MAWSLFSQSAVTPKSWATSVLQAGGWPVTNANLQSLVAWALLEGGGGQYNPLNTTQGAGTNFNSVGVKNFSSWQSGVQATVATINNGYYPNIIAGLKSGGGIGPSASSNLQTWSGSGYSGLASVWTRAAGFLGGTSAPLPPGITGAGAAIGGQVGTGNLPASGSVVTDVWSWIQGVINGTVGVVSAPFDIGASIASLVVPFQTFITKIDWLFHPSHWIRIIAFAGGAGLFGFGIWSMTHVGEGPPIIGDQSFQGVRVPTPKANLPMGIIAVGAGGILLFIAFHNVPDDVQNFQQLVGWVLGGALHPSTPATQASKAAAGQVGAQDPSASAGFVSGVGASLGVPPSASTGFVSGLGASLGI